MKLSDIFIAFDKFHEKNPQHLERNAERNIYIKFCDDRTIFRHLKIGGTESGTYRIFFIVVLGLWEASKLTKKI